MRRRHVCCARALHYTTGVSINVDLVVVVVPVDKLNKKEEAATDPGNDNMQKQAGSCLPEPAVYICTRQLAISSLA